MSEFPITTEAIVAVRDYRTAERDGLVFPGDSRYVEFVYGGILGPTATIIYRRLHAELGGRTSFEIDVADLAGTVGVKPALALRALARLVDFDFAKSHDGELAVRMTVPPASPRKLMRLSESAVSFHLHEMRAVGVAL